MNKFQIGDRVRIIRTAAPFTHHIGTETTVVSCYDPFYKGGSYQLDMKVDGREVWINGEYLQLLYDGNEKVSWSDCAWQPKVAVKS
jgi:hypothetical protein